MPIEMKYLPGIVTLEYDVEKCDGCRMCLEVCPHAVFVMEIKRAKIVDVDRCMECGACALNCPPGALSVDAGVGCATAVIVGSLQGTEPTCGCTENPSCCS